MRFVLKLNKKINSLDYLVKYTNSDFIEYKTDWKYTTDYIFIFIYVAINHMLKF